MAKPLLAFVVGTRPDAIKTAPVVLEMRKYADEADTLLVATGQHREMQAQALGAFGLVPDVDLDVMQHGQTLAEVTTRVLAGLDEVFDERKPRIVFAQGDTTTTFCAGLAAFYRRIEFAHIEAGLRTDSIFDPFPEEFNRRAVGLFAALHFPPTGRSASKLEKENVEGEVYITGNTGIDAIRYIAQQGEQTWLPDFDGGVILLTTHRRENWGRPQQRIVDAVQAIAANQPDIRFVIPQHPNPTVRETLAPLQGHPQFELIEPPAYPEFAKLLQRCDLVLTDSGGVQEEAPALGKPVLVLRETTERPEGVLSGNAMLIGTQTKAIIEATERLLNDPELYSSMATARSPYGDGKASSRIRYATHHHLGIASPEEPMWT